MEINKKAEKHIFNLARCVSAFNIPYRKLGICFSLAELLKTKSFSQDERNFLFDKTILEIDYLLKELKINYQDYSKGKFKNIFEWYEKELEYVK